MAASKIYRCVYNASHRNHLLKEIDMATSKIYISQPDNDDYFNQRLPTWRNGFCWIHRKITPTPDPYEVYEHHGTIKTPTGLVEVVSIDGKEWDIK